MQTPTTTIFQRAKDKVEGRPVPMSMDDIYDVPVEKPRYVLSVPIVSALLGRGQTQAQIATMFDISQASVSTYIKRNKASIGMINNFDSVMINTLKDKALEVQQSVNEDDYKKASLSQKAVATGIFIEKARLLEDKSTANVSVRSTLDDIDRQLKDLEQDA